MNLQTLLRAGKAHVALIGAVLTFVVAHYPDGPWVPYVSAALAVLTALGVYQAPRTYGEKPAKQDQLYRHKRDAGGVLITVLIGIGIAAVIIAVFAR